MGGSNQTGTRSRLPPRLRKEAILRAAFGVFAESGYHGATTRELARAAGVSEVTLFRHFRSKEQIFREAVARHSPIARAAPLPLEGPPRKALAAAGLLAFRTLIANQATVRILLGEGGRHPEVGEAIFAEVERDLLLPLTRRIASWQQEGSLRRRGSPPILARAFLGMFFYHFLTEVFLRRRPFPPARQARVAGEFVTTFLEGTAS